MPTSNFIDLSFYGEFTYLSWKYLPLLPTWYSRLFHWCEEIPMPDLTAIWQWDYCRCYTLIKDAQFWPNTLAIVQLILVTASMNICLKQVDQECLLVPCACRTAVHSSTSVSLFELMFGKLPQQHTHVPQLPFKPNTYQSQLQIKLADHIVSVAAALKSGYNYSSVQTGDLLWLSVCTAGELDPRWDGRWKVKAVKSPVSMRINDGRQNKVPYINQLQEFNSNEKRQWSIPLPLGGPHLRSITWRRHLTN